GARPAGQAHRVQGLPRQPDRADRPGARRAAGGAAGGPGGLPPREPGPRDARGRGPAHRAAPVREVALMAAAALAVVAGLAPGGRAESAEGPALTVVREAHDPDPVPLGAQALREALRPPAEGGLEEAEAALMAVRAAPE